MSGRGSNPAGPDLHELTVPYALFARDPLPSQREKGHDHNITCHFETGICYLCTCVLLHTFTYIGDYGGFPIGRDPSHVPTKSRKTGHPSGQLEIETETGADGQLRNIHRLIWPPARRVTICMCMYRTRLMESAEPQTHKRGLQGRDGKGLVDQGRNDRICSGVLQRSRRNRST